jgi:hypothetical protein
MNNNNYIEYKGLKFSISFNTSLKIWECIYDNKTYVLKTVGDTQESSIESMQKQLDIILE